MRKTPTYPVYSPSSFSPPLSPLYSSSSSSSGGSPRNSPSKSMIVTPDVHARQRQSKPDEETRRERVELLLQDARRRFDSKFEEFSEGTQEILAYLQELEDEQQENRVIFQRQLVQLQQELMPTVLSFDSRLKQVEKMSGEGQQMLARNANDLKGIRMTADMIKDIKAHLDSGKSIKDVLQIMNSKVPAGTLQPAGVRTRQQSGALGANRQSCTTPIPAPTVDKRGTQKAPARRVICEFCTKDLSINSIAKHKRLYCPVLKRIQQG